MIVTGECSASPYELAKKLISPGGRTRVEILELPYPTNLEDLFVDWQVISEGTLGTQGLYRARICPAPGYPMTPAQWVRGADILGEELGLQEPHHRALVLHDDGERAYLHVVWQRTNIDTWTLCDVGRNYPKHENASRRMEREFGHPPVRGKRAQTGSDPKPLFNRDEGRQAKRTGVGITTMRANIAALKAAATSPQDFKSALENVRYILAKGDSGYLIVDQHGSVYSLA